MIDDLESTSPSLKARSEADASDIERRFEAASLMIHEIRQLSLLVKMVAEMRDDGRGLDREKIEAAAIEHGVIAPNQSSSDSDIFGLIIEAGATTAGKVTEISGRGVGMDVVRSRVHEANGRIEVSSRRRSGTTVRLILPRDGQPSPGCRRRALGHGHRAQIAPTRRRCSRASRAARPRLRARA